MASGTTRLRRKENRRARKSGKLHAGSTANWRNSLSPATAFAQRRRADGTWVEPSDLYHFGTTGGWAGPGFLEGTPWIYTWFVPHDVPGLVQTLGADRFNQRLEEGFLAHHVDLTNEPNLQAPWLFNYSGRPWLSQKYGRSVFSTVFDTSPLNGWPGEEDEGLFAFVGHPKGEAGEGGIEVFDALARRGRGEALDRRGGQCLLFFRHRLTAFRFGVTRGNTK